MTQLIWLSAEQPADFPPTSTALEEPNGLLAAGGKLTTDWLLTAYKRGIFPWFNEGEPILWWSPAPRMVLLPGEVHVSRSLKKQFRKQSIKLSVNQRFTDVLSLCADSPTREGGTWITGDMLRAYEAMYEAGFAHSIEVYDDGELVGGLYGVCIDSIFFGESMFSLSSGASKFAFIGLSELAFSVGIKMIDCQLYNPYLASLGAKLVTREVFEQTLPKSSSPVRLGNSETLNQILRQKLSSKTL